MNGIILNGFQEGNPGQQRSERPAGLNRIYPLTAVDQAAPREYLRWMYIFDFPDTSELTIRRAIGSIQRGVECALRHYPFLAGKLGIPIDSVDGNLQLCYSDTIYLGRVREIYKYKLYEDDKDNYENLCRRHMPVCHWKPEEFCAAPLNPDPSLWQPAFTLQANFLRSGGLVLCFAFHHSVADDWSITNFLKILCWGIQGFAELPLQYQRPDLSYYHVPGAFAMLNDFPEWTVCNSATNGVTAYEDRPANYIFVMSAMKAIEWTGTIIQHIRQNEVYDFVRIVDCLVGIIWTEMIRAGQINAVAPNRESRLHVELNGRDQLYPPLDENYFGNMSATSVAQIRNGDEIMATSEDDEHFFEESIQHYACASVCIRRAIGAMSDGYVRHRITFLNSLRAPMEIQKIAEDALHCCKSGTRMSNVGVGADIIFGIPGAEGPNNGRPRFIRRPWMNDSQGEISVVPKLPGDETNWEIQVCLKEWQIESAWPLLKSVGFEAIKDGESQTQ